MRNISMALALVFGFMSFGQSKEEIKKSTANRDKYLFAVKTDPKKFDDTVASEYVTDEILVPVSINGKTYTFLFDTGAVTILSSEVVKELGLTAVTSNKFVDSAGNTSEQNFYVVPEMLFGSVRFQNVGVGSFDLAKFSQLLCRPIHGILGSNVMRVCNWEIDYDTSSIRMSTDRIQIPDAYSVAFTQNFSGTPRIRIEMSGINFLT